MNPRLRKEFRGLLAPWSATLAAAMVMAVGLQSGPVFGNALRGWIKDLVTFFVGLSPVVFFGGIVVMSGAAFGMEFQHRTTALWLSQPTSRGRIWKDKMLTLSIAVVGSSLVAVVGLSLSQRLETEPWKDMELVIPGAALFFLTTVCGACYWTIVARSTMGGIVFSIGSQLGVVLVVVLGFEKLFGNNNRLQVGALTVAGLVYAAIFLVLGWRKFAAFELRDSTLGQGGFQFGSFATWFWRGWLQCAPRSKWANLVRKELGLSLPLFVIAAVFTACWLLSFGALWLMPTRRNGFEIVFAVMTGVYIPVMAVLSGSVGVIEEKSLSTHAWHLTLPRLEAVGRETGHGVMFRGRAWAASAGAAGDDHGAGAEDNA